MSVNKATPFDIVGAHSRAKNIFLIRIIFPWRCPNFAGPIILSTFLNNGDGYKNDDDAILVNS